MKTNHIQMILLLILVAGANTFSHSASSSSTVGRISGVFSKSNSGAAIYTIPIECPVGINTMQPSIALTYNSQSGNGIAGWGWNISGVSTITRSPKTTYYDNTEKEISWTKEDALALDGQRMIVVNTRDTLIEYRLESDPSIKIEGCNIQEWGPKYFRVFTKSGLTMTYGSPTSLNGCIEVYTDARAGMSISKISGWNLTEVCDANGNFMKIEHSNGLAPATRGCLINKITYGGNKRKNTTGDLTITFEYAKRSDEINSFMSGMEYLLLYRLSKIKTAVGNSSQKEYRLNYQTGTISRLSSIELYDRGIKQFDPLVFTYGEADTPKSNVDITSKINGTEKVSLIAVDLKGNGYNDLGNLYNIEYPYQQSLGFGNCTFEAHRYSLANWAGFSQFVASVNKGNIPRSIPALFGDFNGNGSADDLCFYFETNVQGTRLKAKITDRSATQNQLCDLTLRAVETTPFVTTGNFIGTPLANALVIYDSPTLVNGSKYSYPYDLIRSTINPGNVYIGVYNQNTTLVVPSKIVSVTAIQSGTAGYYDDLFIVLESGNPVILKNNRLRAACFSNDIYTNRLLTRYTFLGIRKNDPFSFGDFNNDGLPDIIFRTASNCFVGINKGNGEFAKKALTNIICANRGADDENDRLMLVDINNDNFPDLIVGDEMSETQTIWRFYLNNGNGSFILWYTEESPKRASYSCVADLMGKGKVNWVHTTTQEKILVTDFGFGRNKNLLTKIENPVTPPLKLQYKLQAECKFKDEETFNLQNHLNIGYLSFRTTMMPVLSESNDSLTHIRYDYGRALINWTHKGFMGFLHQKEYDVINNIRIESLGKIYHSNTRYNTLLTERVYKYLGQSSTTPFYEIYNGYNLRALGGNRFVVQQYHYLLNDKLARNSLSEYYTWDPYNNRTKFIKVSESQRVTQKSGYLSQGAWCPNAVVRDTITERTGSDSITKIKRYEYDAYGNIYKSYSDQGANSEVCVTYSGYDLFGNPASISRTATSLSRGSRSYYSTSGRFSTRKTDELSQATTYEWDETRGLLLKETNRIGSTQYGYDNFGNLTSITYPDGRIKNMSTEWATAGSGYKYITTSTMEGTPPLTIWYNTLGREVKRKTKGAKDRDIYTYTEYRRDGQISRISKPTYRTSPTETDWAETYEYDSYGRVTKISTPQGNLTTSYSSKNMNNGWYHSVKTITMPDLQTKKLEYSEDGLLVQAVTNGKTVTFTHTVGGKVKRAAPEAGNVVSFQYDRNGNRTQALTTIPVQ